MGRQDEDGKARWVGSALDQFQAPLIRYALRITGDLERARDIVQDTFLQLCREKPSRIREHLSEWLFTVCRNRALSVRRKESRMTPLNELQAEQRHSPDPGPAERVETQEAAGQILQILESLPSRQQEVVRLKFQNGLSYKEIGRVTHLSVSNVGFLLHTALKKIRQEIEADRAASAPIRRLQ